MISVYRFEHQGTINRGSIVDLSLSRIREAVARGVCRSIHHNVPSQRVRLPVKWKKSWPNLLSNESRHSAAGTPVELEVYASSRDGEIVVRDQGHGIDPLLLPEIFDPFVQGSQSLARSRGGLGLGLAVVRSLVERHGGTVEAQSAGLGRGSRFSIKLPLSHHRAVWNGEAGHIQIRAPSRRIVIVEDNPDVRLTLVRLLERQGHQVFEAQDGTSGLEQIISLRPDLAFVDIGLPGLDGYAIAAQVRAKLGKVFATDMASGGADGL